MAALVLIGLFASLPVLIDRAGAESSSDTVEVTMDFDELAEFSRKYAFPIDEILRRMKEAGLHSVAVEEMTIERLEEEGSVSALSGYELMSLLRSSPDAAMRLWPLFGGRIDPGSTYLITDDAGTFSRLNEALGERMPAESLRVFLPPGKPQRPPFVIEVLMPEEDARKLRLGLSEDDLLLAESLGLHVIPRFANAGRASPERVVQTFQALDGGPKVDTVVFSGDEVLGFPGALGTTAEELTRRGITLGLVEAPVQRGFILQRGTEELAGLMDYRTVRVYSVSRLEIEKNSLGPEEIVERWPRAVQERNIRVAYLRPFFLKGSREAVVDRNVAYVRDVCESIRRAGYGIGAATPFPPYRPGERLLWPIVLGGGASMVMVLFTLFSPSASIACLLPLGLLVALSIRAAFGLDAVCKLSALLSAVTFPALGAIAAYRLFGGFSRRNMFLLPLLASSGLLIATAVTMIGAAYVGALLSNIRYLLELEFFRGVKLTYVAPLFLLFLAFVRDWESGRRPERGGGPVLVRGLNEALSESITVKHLLVLGVVIAAGYVYIARSGHESGLGVSPLELYFRDFLEHQLLVRPRTKEFLVGHPLLMLLPVCLAVRPAGILVLPCLLGAAIGQISVINSFEHLRTPLEISLLRTLNGLWLGEITGLVLVIFFLSLFLLVQNSRRRT